MTLIAKKNMTEGWGIEAYGHAGYWGKQIIFWDVVDAATGAVIVPGYESNGNNCRSSVADTPRKKDALEIIKGWNLYASGAEQPDGLADGMGFQSYGWEMANKKSLVGARA